MQLLAGLFGRAADIAAVDDALSGRGRCVVVGAGGVGKSTVARAVADRSEREVAWIDAEPIENIDALLRVVLDRLSVGLMPGDRVDQLVAAAVSESRALVVIDGVEHLAVDLAEHIGRWTTSAPGPQLLVTSRVALGPGIVPVVRLGPLGEPTGRVSADAAEMMRACVGALGGDMVQLTASPDRFAALVASTGGLPLAIELVSTRIARFGAEFVAAQSLSADDVIDRSITRTLELLDVAAVDLFRRLGLTGGATSIQLLAALADDSIDSTVACAGRLADHGLIHSVSGRFDMLPPVREVARRFLRQAGDDAAALTAALHWALSTFGGDNRRDDVTSQRLLRDDLDECIHLAWVALTAGRRIEALDLIDAVFVALADQLRHHDALALLDSALTGVDAENIEPEREAASSVRAAISASESDTIAHAERWLDRAEAAANRAASPDPMLADILSIRAFVALDEGRFRLAEQHATRSIEVAERIDNGFARFQSQRCIAMCALSLGELDRAEQLAGEVLAWGRVHDLHSELHARMLLAWCQLERGERREAVTAALALRHEIAGLDGFVREVGLECDLLVLAADASAGDTISGSAGLDDPTSSWAIRLDQRLRRAEAFRGGDAASVVQIATDVGLVAGLVPLARPRIDANLLLSVASRALGDRRQALLAAEQALRDAARGPYRLRCADALDALAAVAEHRDPRALALAAAIRAHCGAAAWRSSELGGDRQPVTAQPGDFPSHWWRDGTPTATGIDELVADLREQHSRVSDGVSTVDSLTRAERQIAELVAGGLSNNEIATALFISRRTVETHLTHIFRKLDLRTRTQLATLHVRAAR